VKAKREIASFEPWWREAGPQLLTLVQGTASSSDELFEDFLDVSLHLRDRWSRRVAGLSEERRYSFFIKEWFHRQKLRRHEWEERVLMSALFGLGWTYERIGQTLGLSKTRVQMRAFESLSELGALGRTPHLAKDCARNDLHLIDAVLDRSWEDPLKFYSRKDFDEHKAACPRCTQLYRSFLEGAAKHAAQRRMQVPERLSFAFEHETEARGFWGTLAAPLRWDWYYRIPIQLTVAAIVVLGVIALPYVGELLPKKSSVPVMGALLPTGTPGVAPAPPLPAPAETLPIVESVEISQALDQAFPLDRRSSRAELDLEKAIPLPQAKAPPVVVAKAPLTTPVAPVLVAPPPVASVAQIQAAPAPAPVPMQDSGSRAFFRWGARAQDPDLLASRVQRLLDTYKAVRAGELEWGANYRGGRYFHFTIPEAEYARFQEEIRAMEFTAFTAEQVKSDREERPGGSRVVFWIGPSP
jgi:hypothetical protein